MAKNTPDQPKLGPGRVLIAVYGVFAIAATVRAGFQIATAFSASPVNYSLSALSGLVYILATISLARTGKTWHKIAWGTLIFELTGVLLVGTFSLFFPAATVKQTSVWSYFGMYYLFIPLILPILGLNWLRKQGRDQ